MCGIFGYFNRAGLSFARETLQAMGETIRHRGPDNQGIHYGSGFALGNQRLSIIDIDGGRQPFIDDGGNVIVVQNGEIFNHLELAAELRGSRHQCRTHSDTEVLLRLYEKEGIGFIKRLNGMFAIAIYDAREQALYLIRDRIGVKPLYVYDDGKQLLFGSEIKAIIKSAAVSPIMDEQALHHYLTFNYVPAPFTLYQGIRQLMPGHYLRISKQDAQIKQWWDLAQIEPEHERTEASWIEEFNATLDDAVRLRLRCDVPFGAFLSGGVDSSAIVGLMARHVTEPVKTFCIGFDDVRYDESAFAQQAANRFGARHTMQRVEPDMLDLWPLATWHCDQPHGDVSFLPTYRVSQLAAAHVKVVLTGDGGDELFAGYDKYKHFFANEEVFKWEADTFQRRYFDSVSLFNHQAKQALYSPELACQLADNNSYDIVEPCFKKVAHQDRINQVLFVDMQLLLSGNNLVKPDRMGMAVSLEARTPFLDYRMMELAFRMPGYLKLKNGTTKYLYKKAVTPLIGEALAYRQKQMFTVPVGEWFKHEKADYCRAHMPRGLFSQQATDTLLSQHINGSANHTREIRALIALRHWQSVCTR